MDIPGTNLEEIAQYLTQDFLKKASQSDLEKGVELIRNAIDTYLRQPMSDWKFSSAPNIFGEIWEDDVYIYYNDPNNTHCMAIIGYQPRYHDQREKGEISYWIRLNTDRVVYLHKSPTFGVQAEIKEISNS